MGRGLGSGLAKAGVLLALVLAGGCGRDRTAPTVHDSMTMVMAPQAQALWDVGNRAMGDNGEVDPARIRPSDWPQIARVSRALKERALLLAKVRPVRAAAAGVKIEDEGLPGAAGAAQVQAYIDRDPDGFSSHARDLAAIADQALAASQTRNAARFADVVDRLDEVCDGCHERFWFPPQDAESQLRPESAAGA